MPENPRIEELRRRVQADPASIAFAALAEEFRRIGHYEEAIETCRTGLHRHPAYLSARVTLGRALIEMGELQAAREELETVLKSAPENLAAIRGLAQIHEKLGDAPNAMDPYLAAQLHQSAISPKAPPPPPPPPPEPIKIEPIKVVEAAPEPLPEPEPPRFEPMEDFPIDAAPELPPIEFEPAACGGFGSRNTRRRDFCSHRAAGAISRAIQSARHA
jgi:hypothetical protein